MNRLEERVRKIEERNKRVEADKAWETSITRRVAITVATYAVIALFLLSTGNAQPLLIAVIPAAGYFISTMTLITLKKMWLKGRED